MKTRDLLSICVVTDDDTGISQIGELDFSINVGGLSEFLSVDTYERRNELFKWLGHWLGRWRGRRWTKCAGARLK